MFHNLWDLILQNYNLPLNYANFNYYNYNNYNCNNYCRILIIFLENQWKKDTNFNLSEIPIGAPRG